MEQAFKYRLYPNKNQTEQIIKTFGCSRYVYNFYLNKRIQTSLATNHSMHFFEMSKDLTDLKTSLPWLKEVDKWSLQNALRNLDRNFESFFKSNSGYPSFKSKKCNRKSYRTTYTNNNIVYERGKLKLPRLGWVKIRGGRDPKGRILNATVKQEPSGNFYVILCCTDIEIKPFRKTKRAIGLDFGIKNFIVASNKQVYDSPYYLRESLDKLKRAQRELTRKSKDSLNRNKARLRYTKICEKIVNQRKDFLDKLSTKLVRNYDVICIEDLDIQEMSKNSPGSIISMRLEDLSWYTFTQMLKYKADWYGKTIVKVDRYYPSTKQCSKCGYITEQTKDLNVRVWKCPHCNSKHKRDFNAAINIREEGLRILMNNKSTVGMTGIA